MSIFLALHEKLTIWYRKVSFKLVFKNLIKQLVKLAKINLFF